MDGGAWWATVYGVAELDTTEQFHFHRDKPLMSFKHRRDIIRCMFFKDELAFKALIRLEWSESPWESPGRRLLVQDSGWSRAGGGRRDRREKPDSSFSQHVRGCAQSSDWHLQGWDSGRQSTGVFKSLLDASGITVSEISRKKINTVWYHLHVESKKYKELVNKTKKKIDSWM